MQQNNHSVNDTHSLLQEILPQPSQQVITHRFAMSSTDGNQAADCSGYCSAGACR